MGFFDKLKQGLEKTRKSFTEKIEQLVTGYAKIDDEFLDDLEAVLLSADVGVQTTNKLMADIRAGIKNKEIESPEQLQPFLQQRIKAILENGLAETQLAEEAPTVIIVVGVNGVGKTTTIGKLGQFYHEQGKKVLFAAGDTFRAAAIDQLDIWATRIGAEVIKHSEGSDPAAVAYDAVQAAKARKSDVVIIDTAGRLHTKANLMEELKKIRRVVSREIPEAPHETLLVLDATTGQNAINQAKIFGDAVQLSGVVLTKLDGTAKGGVVIAVKAELGIPVKWIGVGEGVNDLRPFTPQEFSEALFADK
ncbi:signal recognition particle-docking protein FtsY [Anaerospora sp.]|uniref:signal recognition particle-docking protein FtsY n=1 Tax=Anaerospora sp. TaxID=1960278 RepID=UPI00289BFF69|nr:signal recognition particle-docking protein FtsY [Anaerospora sp.]MDF2928378.1 cell division transporter substrate-binding protein FtsY [Anaerospora sp.]